MSAVLIGTVLATGNPGLLNADANETAFDGPNALGQSSITAGSAHTCALLSTGAVKCWGDNLNGQLGNSTYTPSNVPVQVSGLTSGVIAVTAGDRHTCALLSTGIAKCWGFNNVGQLGDDSTSSSNTPVEVVGLNGAAVAITAGGDYTCALLSSGDVKCWGWNREGQLGNNSGLYSMRPTNVDGLQSGVTAISAGSLHACAVLINGTVKCWGDNPVGALGDNSMISRNNPDFVDNITGGVVAIAGGSYHTCALFSSGDVKCWGWNGTGQLGDNSTDNRLTPVSVGNLGAGVAAISTGFGHSCALLLTGAVKCWGFNGEGQLGYGAFDGSLVPVDLPTLSFGVSAITLGAHHACALLLTGAVKCWGLNFDGQLGDNTRDNRSAPVDVIGLSSGVGRTTTTTTTPVQAASVGVPQTVSYTAGNRQVLVSWTSVDGALSYVVTNTNGVVQCTSTALSCTVSGLRNGKAYSYFVYAVNADGVRSTSGTSVSVRPGFQIKTTTLKTNKKIRLSSIVSTPSKGALTWKLMSGRCRVQGTRIVTPAKKGTCKVRLSTKAKGAYPAMSTTITLLVR